MSIMTESGLAGFLVDPEPDLRVDLGAADVSSVDCIPVLRLGMT